VNDDIFVFELIRQCHSMDSIEKFAGDILS
jgi:hypothetical protein